MGRIVVVNFISIDGVIQSPTSPDEDPAGGFRAGGWVPPSSDAVVDGFMQDVTVSAAGMLLGRRSYEILTAAWSQAEESVPAVAAMNRMPKYVLSRTLGAADLGWSGSVLLTELDGVRTARDEVDGELVVFGSGQLVATLAEHDLVDEYRLLLFAVVLGGGRRMFGDQGMPARFELVGTTTASTGVVLLSYRRERG